MDDLMRTMVRHIVKTKFEDLPVEAIKITKLAILDVLGSTIAGSRAEGSESIVDMVKEWGGKEETTIAVFGGKVPAVSAVLANATMARAWDLGNSHETATCHGTEYLLPVALALAERKGRVSGKDLILAEALGEDFMFRMGLSINTRAPAPKTGRQNMFTIFAVTAVAAKLLGLDEENTLMAMGIAYAQACGDMQMYPDNAMTIRVQHGLVGEAAIKSALLAERGITGSRNIFQGKYGFYTVFEPQHDLGQLTSELGKRFEGVNASFKPFPSCRATTSSICATLDLIKQYNIKPGDITEVDVGVNELCFNVVCAPREPKVKPQSPVDGLFSIPYTVAAGIINGELSLVDFTKEALKRPDVLELATKVKTRIDPDIAQFSPNGQGSSIVKIKTKDKKEYSKRVDIPLGNPKNPLTMDNVIAKFRKCCAFSAKPMPQKNIDAMVTIVNNLEESANVTEIIKLTAP